ncbi:MAG: rhodanese-like domain-containing protein [Pseudomonadota bacterium]
MPVHHPRLASHPDPALIVRRSAIAFLFALTFVAMSFGNTVAAFAIDWTGTKEMVRTDFPEATQLSVTGLSKSLDGSASTPLIIDVREPDEYAVSHLPGAINAQGEALENAVREAIAADPERPIVLYCSVGYRSSRETEKLRRMGFATVTNLEGSIFEWANDGLPLVQGGPGSEKATKLVHPYDDEWGTLIDDPERRAYQPD